MMAAAPDVVISGALLLALPLAMLAGLVSFLSPCVLPLAPGYLAYVAGLTGSDLGADRSRARVVVGAAPTALGDRTAAAAGSGDGGPVAGRSAGRGRVTLGATLFVLGFTAVFVSYGLAFGGAGAWLLEHQRTLSVILGAMVVILGLGFLGTRGIGDRWWWNADRRSHRRPSAGLWGAPLLGVLFGVGWTPCIGPTLAAVQTLAFTEASAGRGALLSLAYCLGLGLPFIALALGLRSAAGASDWARAHSVGISAVGGASLIAIGVLLMTGWWSSIVLWLQRWTADFTVGL